MARGDTTEFDEFKLDMGNGVHNLGSDTFKMALITTLPTASQVTPVLGDFTEVSGSGYTAGGETLTVSWANAAGTVTLDFTGDPAVSWLKDAAGPTNIVAGLVYNDTNVGKEAVGWVDFTDDGGTTPVSLQDGDIEYTPDGSGFLTVAEAMARYAPDAILAESGHSSCALSDLTSDPDSGDANWCVAAGNNTNTAADVSFPTPAGTLTTGADLQEFRVEVRKNSASGSGTPTVTIGLYENGIPVSNSGAIDVTSTSGQVVSYTWDAAGRTASQIECHVSTTKAGGPPSARASVDVGGIEWNTTESVTHSVNGNLATVAVTTAAATINATTQVAGATAAAILVTALAGDVNAKTEVDGAANAVAVTTYAAEINPKTQVDGLANAVVVATYPGVVNVVTPWVVTGAANAVAVTAFLADVNVKTEVDGAANAVAVTTYAGTVNPKWQVDGLANAVVVDTYGAVVNPKWQVDGAANAVAVTTYAGTVTLDTVWAVQGAANAVAVDTYAANVNPKWQVDGAANAVAVTTYVANVNPKWQVDGAANAVAVETFSAEINPKTQVDGLANAVAVTTYAADINAKIEVEGAANAIAVDTYAGTVTIAGAYVVTGAANAIAVDTYAADVNAKTDVQGAANAVAVTTYAADVNAKTEVQGAANAIAVEALAGDVNPKWQVDGAANAIAVDTAAGSVVIVGAYVVNGSSNAVAVDTYAADINAKTQVEGAANAIAVDTPAGDVNAKWQVQGAANAVAVATYAGDINAKTEVDGAANAVAVTTFVGDVGLGSAYAVVGQSVAVSVTTYEGAVVLNRPAGYRPTIEVDHTAVEVHVTRLSVDTTIKTLDVELPVVKREIVIDYRGQEQPVLGGDGADFFFQEAGENISALRVAVILGGLAYQCDITNPAHAGQVVGVFEAAAPTGSDARIRRAGVLDITGLTLAEGTVFAGLGGVLATAPNLGVAFVQVVGRCIQANAGLDVDIDESLPIG